MIDLTTHYLILPSKFSFFSHFAFFRLRKMVQRSKKQSSPTPTSWLTLFTFWRRCTSWDPKWNHSDRWGSFQMWEEPKPRPTPCSDSRGIWSGSLETCVGDTRRTRTWWVNIKYFKTFAPLLLHSVIFSSQNLPGPWHWWYSASSGLLPNRRQQPDGDAVGDFCYKVTERTLVFIIVPNDLAL